MRISFNLLLSLCGLSACTPEWKRWDTGAVNCLAGEHAEDGHCVEDELVDDADADSGPGEDTDGAADADIDDADDADDDADDADDDADDADDADDDADDADDDSDADGGADACADELAPEVDWLDWGSLAVGRQTHSATSVLRDLLLTRDTAVYYPAILPGEGAVPDADGGPYPVVFFEHAGGSHYLNYHTLFNHLASHGIVVVSIDHTSLDGSVAWGSADFWDGHDVLFRDTIDEFMEWSASEDHTYSGMADPDRIGLAGHSHGSALLTMQHLGPMSSTSEHTIQAVSLLAPCPDEAIEDYVDVYGGMQPLQVIYGSRDQDGCVAYGQSIAIIEAGGAPSHFVHLDGGSHYGFTDAGGLLDATITRTDHQDMALASWLAWWKYHLEGDTSALPYLRGDRAFFDSGPEYRSQFIEALSVVVDAFNPATDPEPTWIEVPAITGIEGQTYINGFLSDTFVDVDAGIDIIRAEITDLISADGVPDGPASVLFFVDDARGTEAYGLALDELETIGLIAVTQAFGHSEFAALIPGDDGWDLVISATQTGSAADENESDGPLAEHICSGGRAIVSDYRMHSDGAASVFACSLTGFDALTNYDSIFSDGTLFSEPTDLYNPGWGFFTVGLTTEGATVFAHTLVEGPPSVADSLNAFGFPLETEGMDDAAVGWMHDESRGLYHPNWGLELSWTTAGGWVQQRLSDTDGVDLSETPVLSFRLLQIEGDPLNPAGTTHDFHIRLTDAHGTTATIALSDAPQGVLRSNPAVGTGTPAKAVYETYRLALDLFTSAEESIDITQVESVAWVFDINETGALVMDDVVFTRSGRCE